MWKLVVSGSIKELFYLLRLFDCRILQPEEVRYFTRRKIMIEKSEKKLLIVWVTESFFGLSFIIF